MEKEGTEMEERGERRGGKGKGGKGRGWRAERTAHLMQIPGSTAAQRCKMISVMSWSICSYMFHIQK